MNNTLEIQHLNKSFDKRQILKNINFKCETGDIIGIFGRNGTGKSTLLKIIFGILKADSLKIVLNSSKIEPKNIISMKAIGYLPQETFLPKGLKVRDVIPFFYQNGDEQDKIFYSNNVVSFENNKVGNLSMGQLRYLELLIVGNLNHPFLILDEPFSMIEPMYKDIIKDLLVKFKETKGIILTDHYYDDVLQVTNRNILIKDTEQIAINNLEDLQKNGYIK
jgi:ABC-type multidrug transport system ATPase subunit